MSHALLPLVGADLHVPLVDGRRVRHVNLDGAASAPALQSVADRVAEVLPWYASVHRGAGYPSQVSTALYEQSRRQIAAFVGARSDDVTILTRNTTDAINLLASAVPGRVLVLDVEHHANLLPWRTALGGSEVIASRPTVAATVSVLERTLAARRFSLLAVTGASNVTGEALPLGTIADLAHRYGARIFVDGAQLLAHRRVSLRASGIDYLAFSGHKVYAPFGAGALIGHRDWLDAVEPHLPGGGAVRQVGADEVDWAAAPARHEGGTPNLLGAVAIAAAAEAIAALDPARVQRHEDELRERAVAGLTGIEGVEIARIWSDSAAPLGVVTFRVEGTDPGLLATFLAAEHGVSVRDGRFCAHPLLDAFGWPEGAVRASIGLGTSAADVDRLVAGVRDWVAGNRTARYLLSDGVWSVEDDPRPTPADLGISALVPTAGSCAPVPVG